MAEVIWPEKARNVASHWAVWLTNCPWGRDPARKDCGELDSWLNTVVSGVRSWRNWASKRFTAALSCAVLVW